MSEKKLSDLLYGTPLVYTSGNMATPITNITFDSRAVKAGYLFIAIKGTSGDGHQFINQAVLSGAVAIVGEINDPNDLGTIPYIQVRDSREALAIIAANFFGNPARKLKMVAITGTNGKTTCATLLFKLFRQLGYSAGLFSTVRNQINEQVFEATHTTPNPIELHQALMVMVDAGVTHVFMEASSHALDQKRVFGIPFVAAAFLNITHDHLDYHKTFDNYIKAKKLLFDHLPSTSFALTNLDDKRGHVMVQNTRANIFYYSLKTGADFKGKILNNTFEGLNLSINNRDAWFRLTGTFNAYNLLTVYGLATLLGEDEEQVLLTLSMLDGATGRMELIRLPNGITAIVDYAHTPDALKNVLDTINQIRTGNEQLITIVGCGGNRDKEKRPVMGQIAAQLSTKAVFTSDNPRHENPDEIIEQMVEGVEPLHFKRVLRITDRKQAIEAAAQLASKGDIILVAGKGHENYQVIGDQNLPFSDKETIIETFKKLYE